MLTSVLVNLLPQMLVSFRIWESEAFIPTVIPPWYRLSLNYCIDNTYSTTVNPYTSHSVLSLQAPFTPFLTELMYQNLQQLLTTEQTSANASIHYLMIHQVK